MTVESSSPSTTAIPSSPTEGDGNTGAPGRRWTSWPVTNVEESTGTRSRTDHAIMMKIQDILIPNPNRYPIPWYLVAIIQVRGE